MTAAVVLILGVATLVIVLGAFVATARQGRTIVPAAPPPPPEPEQQPAAARATVTRADYFDPRTIKVGDTVHVEGVRSRAIGALHVSWQGSEWTDYLLDDGTRRYQWLSVEERRGLADADPRHLEVLLWTLVPTEGMVPARHMLIMEGVEFSPVERGTAAFRSEGVTGHPDKGLLDFADYRADDGRLLSFERVQGGQWQACYAQALTPGSIRVERLP
ncbi:DUF4178 domain-containing protein [Planotetraspora sp. A-T 1434]|uniref:DUF4178 domain-containing protein n=1 Tax=Planotetraspora sp. A-T 1434 TaxID=2979219 RepID=UPI0021BE9562|nr:DUF4178 domain-containing protein [Planotetraspora sp. A-T 1434]MCT9932620.1 DUF4178 domain-containing protein [Planotetraspora sp. A-T 1434]